MQIEPINSFDDENEKQTINACRYNIELIKKYVKNAPVSIFSWILMLVMFLISIWMTYSYN